MTIERHSARLLPAVCCLACSAMGAGLPARAEAADKTPLMQQAYLLLDPRVVESAEHVTLRLGSVTKHPANPLMREDKPWEVRYDNVYANVIYDKDERLFKCWYSPYILDEATTTTPVSQRATKKYYTNANREMALCYAFSKDGVHWTKPELGIVEYAGNKKNNLVLRNIHGAGIIKHPSESDETKRFKLFAGSQVPGQKRFMIVASSADGIHWPEPTPCPEIESTGDTHNNLVWAADLKRFIGFTREFRDQRLVMRTESPDFVRWTKAVEVLRGDALRQTYAMQVFPSHGIYLGMLAILDTKSDRVHCELAASADTIDWRRVCPGIPLVPNSSRPGDYDYGCVYAAKSPITRGNDVSIYYGGSNAPHGGWRDSCLALATIKRDRWAGYEHSVPSDRSSGALGLVRTAPVLCRGKKLRVNVLAPRGSLRVGIVGDNRLSTDLCDPISGDAVDAEVTWNTGAKLSQWVGKPVQLEFKIENGAVYAFEFAE